MKIRFYVPALTTVVFLIMGISTAHVDADPLSIGSDKQLFIDLSLVETQSDITLVMNPPVKRGIVLPADKPWENYRMGSYGEVFEDDGLYRMWYEASSRHRIEGSDDYTSKSVTCYAVSVDGIHWENLR